MYSAENIPSSTQSSIFFFFLIFFANPSIVGGNLYVFVPGQNVRWVWVVVLELEVVCWDLFSFGVGSTLQLCMGPWLCICSVSPACLQGQSAGRLQGSAGASHWVAVQKVVLGAHNQVQCFALAVLCSCTCATPSLLVSSWEKGCQYFSSVPYSVLLAFLYLPGNNDLSWNHKCSSLWEDFWIRLEFVNV